MHPICMFVRVYAYVVVHRATVITNVLYDLDNESLGHEDVDGEATAFLDNFISHSSLESPSINLLVTYTRNSCHVKV